MPGLLVLVLALVIEKAIGFFKDLGYFREQANLMRFISLFLGVFFAIVIAEARILTTLMKVTQPSLVFKIGDILVTGLIIARGSNVVHDLIKALEYSAEKKKLAVRSYQESLREKEKGKNAT
jgi:hypothetical protein